MAMKRGGMDGAGDSPGRLSRSAGVTLVELMVATAIISIGVLGFVGSFSYISKGIRNAKSRTLAANPLTMEKLEVLRRYRVERVLSPELDYASPMYDEWRRVIKEKGTETTLARAGQRITLGEGVFIDVLNPLPELMAGTASDIDNNGVVLRVSDGRVSFILTSDIQREAERALVRERAGIAGTGLKVAHHGSDTSSSPGFLAVVSPRVAVISVGADNRFGHPAPDVVSRLEDRIGKGNVYRTDERGAIDFVTDGQRLWV